MTKIYLLFGVIIVLALAVFIVDSLREKEGYFPYQKKKYFLTPTEKIFFEVLLQIINNQYFVFPQVHIASIVEVKRGESKYMAYFNKIIRKSFDFVIFDKQTLNALLVIELDDKSHERPDRMQRDEFVNSTLEVSDLKIIHIKPQSNYNILELSRHIFESIHPVQSLVNQSK